MRSDSDDLCWWCALLIPVVIIATGLILVVVFHK
jgi:hypothetical protein